LITFLTIKGSLLALPDFGTNFISEIRSGIAGETEVTAAFNAAAALTISQLTETALSTDTPDETIISASLLDTAIAGRDISIKVALTTAAGTQRIVELPVATVPV
jgi:hypothetical protein